MDLRDLFQTPSLDHWVRENSVLSAVFGAVLVGAAVVMFFLNAFEVITGPLQNLAYLLMGLGVALIVVARTTSPPLDDENPSHQPGPILPRRVRVLECHLSSARPSAVPRAWPAV